MATHSVAGTDVRKAVRRVALAVVACTAASALPAAGAAPEIRSAGAVPAKSSPITVAVAAGTVRAARLGQAVQLTPGSALRVGDAIHVGEGSRLSLAFAGGGNLQASAGARVVVETLPSSEHPLAPMILNLERGRMHLTWSPVAASPRESLFVYTAGQRIALTAGEYFLVRGDNRVRVCAAAGAAELRAVADGGDVTVAAPACWQQHGTQPAQVATADPAFWGSLRAAFVVPAPTAVTNVAPSVATATGERELAQAEPTRARSQPAATTRPITHTARREAGAPEDAAAWAVNIASYTDKTAARSQCRQLQSSGYEAVVVPSEIGGKTWFRVQLKGFPTSDAAQSKAAMVTRAMGYGKLWVVRQQ